MFRRSSVAASTFNRSSSGAGLSLPSSGLVMPNMLCQTRANKAPFEKTSNFLGAAAAASGSPLSLPNMPHPPETIYSALPNGFKVASEHVPHADFSTIGVWIDAGSRFETTKNNGVAHFLEHLNFKGTKKFNKKYIDSLFEFCGAHFNAYTSRDRTAYYIKSFNKDLDKIMELLSDILTHGLYKPQDIHWERPTILAEMREVESLVDEVIMDNLHLTAYDPEVSGLPLTILGPEPNIMKHIDREMVVDFVETHYTGPRMTLVCSGGMQHKEVEGLASKWFGHMSDQNNRPELTSKYLGGHTAMWNAEMATNNIAWAIPVCGATNKQDIVALQLAQSVLGNYRRDTSAVVKHQSLKCKNEADNKKRASYIGVDVESVQPFLTPYEESSLFGFYAVTLPMTVKDSSTMNNLVTRFHHDLSYLSYELVEADQLELAKNRFKAAQLVALDSTTNSAEDLGRQMIHLNRRTTLQEQWALIDAVTPQFLRQTLHKYYVNARPTISTVGQPGMIPEEDVLMETASRVSF